MEPSVDHASQMNHGPSFGEGKRSEHRNGQSEGILSPEWTIRSNLSIDRSRVAILSLCSRNMHGMVLD